jgi:hypothetical protein
MHAFSRLVFSWSVAVALSACSSSQTPPLQSNAESALSSAAELSNGHLTFQKISIRPDAGAPATMMNFIANGPNQGGVPCIACVGGASSNDTIGLTGPSSYVRTNASWQYDISFTDLSYKGKCTVAFAITSGKKTIDSFSASFALTSAGGFVIYGIGRSRPKYSGPATVKGSYTCGKNKGSTTEPLYFE